MSELEKLATELGAALKSRGFMLVLAESCTGGMVAQAVTSVAGSSAWFDRGFVTYSNAAKIDMLGVSAETLKKFGAVSEQTAIEMALGCLKASAPDYNQEHCQAHIAGSITGIAGPDGGTADKPVGTVCFGIAQVKQSTTITKHFSGNRETVRQRAAAFLMQQLIQWLNRSSQTNT